MRFNNTEAADEYGTDFISGKDYLELKINNNYLYYTDFSFNVMKI